MSSLSFNPQMPAADLIAGSRRLIGYADTVRSRQPGPG
jgi:hypothetical protein